MKKRTVILYLLCACAVVSCLACASCGRKRQKYSAHSFAYFDTVTTVLGYAESQEAFDAVCADIFDMLGEYHRLFNVYERYEGMENLCTVNALENGTHETVQADGRIIDLLLYAKEMCEKTNGAVNIAMGSVLSI
jgi:thiamine biosynthesis lipoprotein